MPQVAGAGHCVSNGGDSGAPGYNGTSSYTGEYYGSVVSPKLQRLIGGLHYSLIVGRLDWASVITERSIPRKKHSRMKGDNGKIRQVLRFVFQADVTQFLAWGSIGLKCGYEWKVILGIIGKLTTEHMWRARQRSREPSHRP